MATLTAANSQFSLAVQGLYPAPKLIQGYAVDDAFNAGDVETAENFVGVDGQKSSGFVFALVDMNVVIMPTSISLAVFNNWAIAQRAAREVLIAQATILLPAIGFQYACTNGTLTRYKPLPDVKKVLQPVTYVINWESVQGAPL